jgi:hypothetical protein
MLDPRIDNSKNGEPLPHHPRDASANARGSGGAATSTTLGDVTSDGRSR